MKTDTGGIKTQTDGLTFTVTGKVDANATHWKGSTAPAMTGDAYAALTSTLAASVPADGSRPTLQQAVYALFCEMSEKSISGTTMTINNPDGTALMTITLNSSTTPTSFTRTS